MPHHRPIHRGPHTSTPSTRSKQHRHKHKTISTAPILKRKPMAAIYSHRRRHAHQRRREKSGHPLMRDYKDDVAKCRDHAESKAITALSNAHTHLLSKVNTIKTTNTTLLTTLSTQSSALLLPLDSTDISATTTTGGVGVQIENFRARLAAAEKELERLWGKWDEAQGEIEKLGEGGGVMKGWEEEVKERIAEMEREVGEAGREAVKAVGEAEKEIDKKLREDQAQLVEMMFKAE
ncbi:hypothetical protein VE00_01839 [Pseudogymnoascus sp. WSF 3629]|nr:hypothetical protein VE00_01839 [Pseudogymnoascus sp. WSF 3629]